MTIFVTGGDPRVASAITDNVKNPSFRKDVEFWLKTIADMPAGTDIIPKLRMLDSFAEVLYSHLLRLLS